MKYTIDLPNDIDDFVVKYNGTTKLIKIVKERRVKVVPYKIIRKCPECDGEMVWTGDTRLTSPLTYVHTCNNCDKEEDYSKKYPYIHYEEEE